MEISNEMNTKVRLPIAILIILIALGVGYWWGYKVAFQKGDTAGYGRAETDAKALQEAAAQKATEEAAKAANPFQAANPLEGVESNPFQKAKKVLNPFE